tara:strand:+ start:53 stop:622 length:570 start_codon:yes stop_codon:yes gene_type:complete
MMHGHSLMIEFLDLDPNIKGKTLIEIGTTREGLNGQDSSSYFYKISKERGISFTTVDMDSENTERIKDRFSDIDAICSKGEDFLQNFAGTINYLYIDAFDFHHNNHSSKRCESYRKNLDTTINDKSCHKMHLDCVANCIEKISEGGVVVIDDCFGEKFERGKGVTAIPFLIDNGFKVIRRNSQAVALQR